MKYVYVMKAGENKYKVGVSVNVRKRAKSIQTGNGDKVYIVMAKLCEHAEVVEQKTHAYLRKFSEQRGGTEWFSLDPEDVLRVCILINQEPEVDVYANTDLNKQLGEQTLRHKRLEKKLDMILNIAQKQKPRQTISTAESPVFVPSLSREEVMDAADAELLAKARSVVVGEGRASTSMLQRVLRIGYGRAARIIEEMERQGIIGPTDGPYAREILVKE